MTKLVLIACVIAGFVGSAFANHYTSTVHTNQGDIVWEIDDFGSTLEATANYPDGSVHHMTGSRYGDRVEWTFDY
jgi:hypothetical protein